MGITYVQYNTYIEKKKKIQFLFLFIFLLISRVRIQVPILTRVRLKRKKKKKLNPGMYIDYQYRFKNEASERKSWNSVYEFIFYSWNDGRNVLSTFLYGDCSSKPVCKEKMEKRKKQ